MKDEKDGIHLTLVNPETKRKREEHFNIGARFSITPDQIPDDDAGGFLPDTTSPTAVVDGDERPLDFVIKPGTEYEVVEEVDEYENRSISIQEVGQEDDD